MSQFYRILLVFLVGMSIAFSGIAQSNPFKKADQYFENEAYPTAAKLYLAGLSKGSNQQAIERLAKCYANTGQLSEASKWYEKAVQKTSSAAVAWDYAQVLKSTGNYTEAAKMFDRYGELSQRYDEARIQGEACERAAQIKGDGQGWKVNPTDLNSKASDFGPVLTAGKMTYVSARQRGFFTRVLNLRNDNLFYDVYRADAKGPVTFGKSKLQRGSLKTRYHDGPLVFTKDMNTVYITRSNFKKGKLKRDQQNRAHLQIYTATLVRGKKYKHATLLPFNSDGYSTGHPALSADGKSMVFACDMPGGQGGSDLYIAQLENGKWSTPRNLGPEVNSPGDELFPYISSSGMLFFASNGHPGLGGLDIFFGYLMPDGNWSNIKNPGAPLNSPMDDFSIVWDSKGQGYFASNRSGGKGDDDIYQFSRIIPMDLEVVDQNGQLAVEAVQVDLLSSSGGKTALVTDGDGKANTYIDWGKSYKIALRKEGYRPTEAIMDFDPEKSAGGRALRVEMYKYPVASVNGAVLEAPSGAALAGAKARIVGEQREFTFTSGDKGSFQGPIDTASIYTAIVEKPGYFPAFSEFNSYEMVQDVEFPVWSSLRKGGYVLVEGQTVDKSTGAKLAGTKLRALTVSDSVVNGPVSSRKDGKFWIAMDRRFNTDLLASRDGYFTARVDFEDFSKLQADSAATLTIELVPAKVGELVKIIYYDYRESYLTQGAKNNLEEIVYFLLDNPTAVVELSAHTDARGTDDYNQKLSEARAKAAVDYVVSKGISKDRIAAKGYGETQLSNDCGEGKECTDEQHAANRRTEIRVTAIK